MTDWQSLPDNIVDALRAANATLRRDTDAIQARYAEAERTGDYSDADEFAADDREHLHDTFSGLMQAFADEYPDLLR